MAWRNASDKYGWMAMGFHWLTVAMIFTMAAWGLYMTGLEEGSFKQFEAYQVHKSFGVTLLAITALRLFWRRLDPPPSMPAAIPARDQKIAKLGHWFLYGLLILQPLLGWAVVSASPLNIPTELFGTIPWPHIPWIANAADKEALESLFAELHEITAFTLLGVGLLHGLAAFRHRRAHGVSVPRRMWPGPFGRR